MSYIIAFIGPSGSGKSTLARDFKHPDKQHVIVNRDSLREMLFGYAPETVFKYYDHPLFQQRENLVSSVQDSIIREGLNRDKIVLIDNTNLSKKYLDDFKKFNVPIEYCWLKADNPTTISPGRASVPSKM